MVVAIISYMILQCLLILLYRLAPGHYYTQFTPLVAHNWDANVLHYGRRTVRISVLSEMLGNGIAASSCEHIIFYSVMLSSLSVVLVVATMQTVLSCSISAVTYLDNHIVSF